MDLAATAAAVIRLEFCAFQRHAASQNYQSMHKSLYPVPETFWVFQGQCAANSDKQIKNLNFQAYLCFGK
jgi:hypothetical protein